MGISLAEAPADGPVTADDGEDCGKHLRFPAGFAPHSRSSIYDTRLRGRSKAGHESPFSRMTESEKRAVLEFLKLL